MAYMSEEGYKKLVAELQYLEGAILLILYSF